MSLPFEEIPANPYAPPAAEPPVEALPSELPVVAERSTRLVAAFVDGIAFFLPSFLILAAEDELWPDVVYLLLALVLLALLVVQCVLLHRRGQTLGKLACSIRIVRSDGHRAGLARLLLLRSGVLAALTSVPIIGNFVPMVDVLAIFRKDRRCLHDHLADTIVVKWDPTEATEAAPEPAAGLAPSQLTAG